MTALVILRASGEDARRISTDPQLEALWMLLLRDYLISVYAAFMS